MTTTSEIRELIKNAYWAIWFFIILNSIVLLVFWNDGILNKFVFICLFLQVIYFLVYLLPVFLYQIFCKKVRLKFAIYTALAAYKEAFRYISF